MSSTQNHPFPSCIDCKIYKGLCGLHASQVKRKAGTQSEPYSSVPIVPPTPKAASSSSSPATSSSAPVLPKEAEARIREESAKCIDCKIYKSLCGIHATKLRALTRSLSSPTSPASPASPVSPISPLSRTGSSATFFKNSTSPLNRTMTGRSITRTTSFTGLASVRRTTTFSSSTGSVPTASSPISASSSSQEKSKQSEPASKKSDENAKKTSSDSRPVHDGPSHCPNCRCVRDIDDALFCGDCGYNYSSKNSDSSDTGSVATTASNSTSSQSSVSDTVCKDCGSVRDPPDSLFCGECGYRFPALGGDDDLQVQAF